MTYVDYFNAFQPQQHLAYVQGELQRNPVPKTYRDHFRLGLIHSAKMLLIPQLAFERGDLQWPRYFSSQEFLTEYRLAREAFQASRDVGRGPIRELEKINRRIDRNRDQILSEPELIRYLSEKIQILKTGG